MKPHQDTIAAIVASGKEPSSKDFKDIWTDYKGVLSKHQHGKCGFCEAPITPVAAGDVEHYAPKSQVGELDPNPATWGEEEGPFSNRVKKSRTVVVRSELGYWWLAYEWSNYLFACQICNQKWKRTLFPVAEDPRTFPPSPSVRETPLLLNPYGDIDPTEHLFFTDIGAVEAKGGSVYGAATIRTCFLDRSSLTQVRAPLASDAAKLARRILRAQKELRTSQGDTARDLVCSLADLITMGDEGRPFAGMVRIIAQEITHCPWDQLVALRDKLGGE